MSRVEGELPEFRIGRVVLTATELAGLAEYEAASRSRTLRVEGSQEREDFPTKFYGKVPTRQKFILQHGTKPDPETGTQILMKMPHRHISCEAQVARERRAKRRLSTVPPWSLRAPKISDEDHFEPSDTPGFEPPPTELFLVPGESCVTKLADVLAPALVTRLFRQS